ncbi:MAG: hypothetical protein MUO70_04150 [Euryarchaeota archaeon]|nr:hypothetical protein [Euryarchaeota archaeon]
MALHVAIALERPVILFNNIFHRHEFHLYGRGEILEPGLACQGCYKRRFDSECAVDNCMKLIHPARVLAAVERWLPCDTESPEGYETQGEKKSVSGEIRS